MPPASGEPLAIRILSHLVELDLSAGAHVGEQELADAMAVSRTPIRKALLLLSRKGLLTRVERRGYFLAAPSSALFAASKDLSGLNEEDLFVRIGIDHLDGRLRGVLTDQRIAAHYGVAMRHAQLVLESLRDENVVVPKERGGWQFNAFLTSPEASLASYAYRLAIEPQIPLLATFKPRRGLLKRCRDEHIRFLALRSDQRTGRIAFKVDAAFHEAIAVCGNNPFFHSGVVQHNRLRQLLEYRDSFAEERVVGWLREHLAIMEAISDGDFPETSRLLEIHLSKARRSRSFAAAGADFPMKPIF